MVRPAWSRGLVLSSRRETESIGRAIGRVLHEGNVLALIGELGAGKTALVHGIVSGLDAPSTVVTSPTFMLMRQYHGRLPLTHMDLYRLKSSAEAEAIGLAEVFTEDSVTAIEWADRFPNLLPSDHLEIRLTHRTFTTRSAQLIAHGVRSRLLFTRITRVLPSEKKRRDLPNPKHRGKRKASHR
ncbi:MAG: tRNA (adenosine(37)-N6)-threonylcarbamoyltransferase complex ATPase subunit type 1 TsaE [Nitrospira sp.]|nr:tRNA (adenosine(37)-N6)-threonylcarbamoyltransferase complex ATPase subunit type 1 TsaE [Nitrospira sp.]